MNMGWTWMSLNVEDDDMSTTAVFASIDSQLVANDYLKSQTSFSQYYPGFGFYGTLSALDTAQMYKVQMANSVTLTFSGTPTPLPKTVMFLEGWNYMPCPFQTTTGLDIGQPSLAYTQDDQIKSQTVFATYYDGYGWFGNLNELYPGAGYKMKLATGGDAIFPDLSSGRRLLEPSLLQYRKPSVSHWTVNPSAFAETMTVTAEVTIGNVVQRSGTLAAFVKDSVRGVQTAPSTAVGFVNRTVYLLTLYTDQEGGEWVSFWFCDELNITTALQQTIFLKANGNEGSLLAPLSLAGKRAPLRQRLSSVLRVMQ